MKRFVFMLDLVNDESLIREYEERHQKIWPAISQSIIAAGIRQMEIYRMGIRLCMIVDAKDDFTLERKQEMDALNLKVQEWERQMEQYQQIIPGKESGKWQVMTRIFNLTDNS